MKREKKPIKDKTRNNNFAAVFAYLRSKDEERFGNQAKLAKSIGVEEDTITNILSNYSRVSESTITKLYNATGGLFNLQFLRGQSSVMLAEDLPKEDVGTNSAAYATALADKEEVIAELRGRLSDKDDIIRAKDANIADLHRQLADKDEIIATKDALIKNLQQTVASLRADLSMEKGLSTGHSNSASADPDHRPRKEV